MFLELGSWADLLRRTKNDDLIEAEFANLDTVPARNPASRPLKTTNSRTQTDPAVTTAPKVAPNPVGQSKEYIETINQLHQLCSKLKAEVSELNQSKDRMESDLLNIIREKDAIISSYHAAQTRSPAPVRSVSVSTSPSSSQGPTASKDELSKFRGVIQ